MEEKEYLTLRVPKRVLLFIYILLCVVVVVIAYNNWPRYVVLNPPTPNNGFVIDEEKMIYNPYTTSRVKSEEGHNTWTWRREYGFLPAGGDLYTSASTLAYFDKWLNEQGWKNFDGQGNPCDIVIKTGLLEQATSLFAYVPENTTGSYYSSVVCLATWSYTTEDGKTGFIVLLFTATK